MSIDKLTVYVTGDVLGDVRHRGGCTEAYPEHHGQCEASGLGEDM